MHWLSRSLGKPKIDLQDKDTLWKILEGEAHPRSGLPLL
jgi:hypothetical protein